MSDIIHKMVENKDFKMNGYDEQDFPESYWISPNASLGGIARIDKPAHQAIDYFTDLCQLTNTQSVSILDIGAGAGNVVNALRKEEFQADGVEYSASGRKVAFERFGIIMQPLDLRYDVPIKTNAYDWSMCIGVLSMIPEQYLVNAIREILRITKYGVLINIGTFIPSEVEGILEGNKHHLTRKSIMDWYKLFLNCKAYDWTGLQPPQNRKYGIGVMSDEFAGLFSKSKMKF